MVYRGNKVNKMFYRTLFCGQVLGKANIILLPEFHGTEIHFFSSCLFILYFAAILWFMVYYRNRMLLCCGLWLLQKQNAAMLLFMHCVKSVQIGRFFWSVFSCIRTEYGDLLRKSLYSVRIQENMDQKKLRIWTFSRSDGYDGNKMCSETFSK